MKFWLKESIKNQSAFIDLTSKVFVHYNTVRVEEEEDKEEEAQLAFVALIKISHCAD